MDHPFPASECYQSHKQFGFQWTRTERTWTETDQDQVLAQDGNQDQDYNQDWDEDCDQVQDQDPDQDQD